MADDDDGPQLRRPQQEAFLRGLGELGAEGKPERYPIVAAELVRLQVDVIVAAGPALPALKQATSTIPVVMTAASDALKSLSNAIALILADRRRDGLRGIPTTAT